MEGEQPKIRTMTKDLEEARRRAQPAKNQIKTSTGKEEVVKYPQMPKRAQIEPPPKSAAVPPKPVSKTLEEAMQYLKTPSPQPSSSMEGIKAAVSGSREAREEIAKPLRQAPIPPQIRPQPPRSPLEIDAKKLSDTASESPRTQISDIRQNQPQTPEKTLAQILNEASSRIDTNTRKPGQQVAPPTRPTPRPESRPSQRPESTEISLDELLPIEEKMEPKPPPPARASGEPPQNLPLEELTAPTVKPIEPSTSRPQRAFPEVKSRPIQPAQTVVEPKQAPKETPEEILGINPNPRFKPAGRPEFPPKTAPVSEKPFGHMPLKSAGGGMLTPDEIAELAKNIPYRKSPQELKTAIDGPTRANIEPPIDPRKKPKEALSQEEEIEKLLEEREGKRQGKPNNLFKILLILLLALSLSGGGYFAFLKFYKKGVEEPPAPPEEQKPPIDVVLPQPPKPILRADSAEILKIRQINNEEILAKLEILENRDLPEKSVTYIAILLHNDKEARFLTLSELFDLMKVQAPATIRPYSNYSLYLYQQTERDKELCLSSGIPDKTCYGPRLGLVIDLSSKENASIEEEKGESLKTMVNWEATSIVQDLSSFILAPIPATRPPSFLSGRYNDNPTRYINLPIHTTSIDWMLIDKYLIIATSMDTARTAIDRLGTE